MADQPPTETENTLEQQRKMGRPLKFEDVAQLDHAIDQYFQSRDAYIAKTQRKVLKSDGSIFWADDEELMPARPKTMSGLARALDCDRKTLLNYKERPEFFPSIARALAECEEYTEEQLLTGRNAHGAQFSLKNNYGWKDQTEVITNPDDDLAKLDAEDEPPARSNVADDAKKALAEPEQQSDPGDPEPTTPK